MSRPLRVLLIEDSERDAALLSLYLRRAGYSAELDRIETAEEMRARLAADWNVIISDVNLPSFGAEAALQVLHESGRSIPLIVLSAEVNERVIQRLMAAGASQYLLKDDMRQIVAVIERVTQAER